MSRSTWENLQQFRRLRVAKHARKLGLSVAYVHAKTRGNNMIVYKLVPGRVNALEARVQHPYEEVPKAPKPATSGGRITATWLCWPRVGLSYLTAVIDICVIYSFVDINCVQL